MSLDTHMLTHYLKYFVVFWIFYLVLMTVGLFFSNSVYATLGVNVGSLVSILSFYASLAAALRTGDGIYPKRLDGSHLKVAADIRAHGIPLGLGFAFLALASDLTLHNSMALLLGAVPEAFTLQHKLALLGFYAVMGLLVLNFEQYDDASSGLDIAPRADQ